MTFIFKYEDVTKKLNPMVKINPLRRGTGKTVSLQDRIDKLEQAAVWKKAMKVWQIENKKVDIKRMPKVAMVKLGQIEIDEDIQRQLDEKHCANKIADVTLFDPALLQTLQCIKTSKGKYKSVDGQHTASTVAGLISAGYFEGITDWKEFEFPVQYIETDNLAFARRAFSILNGKGKKKQRAYQQLRNAIFIVRIDKDETDDEDVEIEKKVSVAEKYNCFPVEADSDLAKYPGTFTNIATFKTLNETELEVACGWHDKYFHYENVHVSLFFIYRDLCRQFTGAKLKLTPKLQEELAAEQAKTDVDYAEEAPIPDSVANVVGDLADLAPEIEAETQAETEAAPKGKRGPKGARLTPEQRAASDERRQQQTKNWKSNKKAVDAARAAGFAVRQEHDRRCHQHHHKSADL